MFYERCCVSASCFVILSLPVVVTEPLQANDMQWPSTSVHIQEPNLSNREREKRERENILFKKINFHFSSEICQIITNTGICTIFHSVPLMVPGAKCLLIRYFKTCFKISTALCDYFYKPELHVSRGSQNIHLKFGGGGGGIEQLLKKTSTVYIKSTKMIALQRVLYLFRI